MSRLTYLVVGIVIGGAAVFASLNYHILRTRDGVAFVPKATANFEDVYVDIREFGVSEWLNHRDLALAVVKSGKEHLMQQGVTDEWRSQFEGFLDTLSQ